MEEKKKNFTNKTDAKDDKPVVSRQFLAIKIIFLVFFIAGLVGIVVSQIVLPREGDDSVFFCEEFNPPWAQVMEDGTRKPIDVKERLEGERGQEFLIETKVTARLAAYGYLCVKSMRSSPSAAGPAP